MHYIIDAYNLAYALSKYGKEFDLSERNNSLTTEKNLINIIKKWLGDKNKQVTLVFDSQDPMGDKITKGNLTIVYAPRDNYYQSADDKIIEIARQAAYNQNEPELIVVTDDREIKDKVSEIANESKKNINLENTGEFAQKLRKNKRAEIEAKKFFGKNDIKKLNKELLNIWKE